MRTFCKIPSLVTAGTGPTRPYTVFPTRLPTRVTPAGRRVRDRLDPCASASHSTPAPISSVCCSRRLGTWYLLRMASGSEPSSLAFGDLRRHADAALRREHAAITPCPLPAPPGCAALRTLDHIAIYFLIAGTYTPVAADHLARIAGLALLGRELDHRRGGHPVQDPVSGCAGLALDRDLSRRWGTSRWWRWCRWPRECRDRAGLAGRGWRRLHGRGDHLSPGTPGSVPRTIRTPRDLASPGAGRQRLPLRLHALHVASV